MRLFKREHQRVEKEFQELNQSDNELSRMLNTLETDAEKNRETYKQIKKEKNQLNEKLLKMKIVMAEKDALYEQQLTSGLKCDSLPKTYAQKENEFESAQKNYYAMRKKIETIHMEVNKMTEVIEKYQSEWNELVDDMKKKSQLTIDDCLNIELIDFHTKDDVIGHSNVNKLE